MFKFVKNQSKYYEFIRNLRNNENVKTGFIDQKNITKEEQIRYMEKYSENYFICLEDDSPVGYIGQIENDIRLAVLPDKQGKGIGAFMVNNLMEVYPDAYAKIKVENKASIRLFEKCGFKEKYIIMEHDKKRS